MKNKFLILVSCCAAAAFIASPASAGMHKKSGGMFKPNGPHMGKVGYSTRQMMAPGYNTTSRVAGIGQQVGTHYYGASRYAGTPYYGNNVYYGGTPYYYGSGWGYGNYSVWPYVAASVAPVVASSLWAAGYNSYNSYPYSYGGGYPYRYSSYYDSGYSYNASTVAAVQRRLGEMGYYHGVVDGAVGPRTRSAIATFENRHGLVVDGTISRPLLNRLGLG